MRGSAAQATSSRAGAAFEAYARLIRMLLPSSGSMSVYSGSGEPVWSSDPVEWPEARALIEELVTDRNSRDGEFADVRRIGPAAPVLVAAIAADGMPTLGYVVIELGGSDPDAAGRMAVSLTRPLFACMRFEFGSPEATPAAEPPPSAAARARLDFVLALGELPRRPSRETIRAMLTTCVAHLDCVTALLWLPERDLDEVAAAPPQEAPATRERIAGTRRHLLAWARHNRRPMVVNRIDSSVEQYKILSCPIAVPGGDIGLLAVFRAATGRNFELDDVRVVEFLARGLAAALPAAGAGETDVQAR